MELIDTHAHLDFPEFDADRDAVIAEANRRGISRIINIGASFERSIKSVELADRYPCVYATVGIHPHDADMFTSKQVDEIGQLSRHVKVVGIGEIGLDYYKNYSRHDNQRRLFIALLGIAKDTGLPLVVHSREASADTLAIMKEFMPVKAVVHCFSGDESFLKACLELGFYISFTCNITYKKADVIRSSLNATPLERLMLETDAPFLPPEGLRGKRNDPSQVAFLAEEVAKLRCSTMNEIAAATTANARAFFNRMTI